MKNNSIFKIFPILSIIGCSSPKFIGFESQKIAFSSIEKKSNAKSNHVFQKELLNSTILDNSVIKAIDPNSPVIVTNYNLYPFNIVKSGTDSTPAIYRTTVDDNINSEFSIHMEKQLLNRNFNVLENEQVYNLYDNNFDEYGTTLNYEILRFGIYYEKISSKVVIRHGIAEIRYKVLNKLGFLKIIKDETSKISDTISDEDISVVSSPLLALGYDNFWHDRKLTNFSTPLLGSSEIKSIYTTPPLEKIDSQEIINGIKFKLPSETKQYSLWVFDNKVLSEAKLKKGGNLSAADLVKLSPSKIILNTTFKKSIKGTDGSTTMNFFSVIKIEDLRKLFKQSNELVLFYKTKPICTLRKYSDGSIQSI